MVVTKVKDLEVGKFGVLKIVESLDLVVINIETEQGVEGYEFEVDVFDDIVGELESFETGHLGLLEEIDGLETIVS